MGNLPATLRAQLNETCVDLPMAIQEVHPSKRDDTVKFLFACRDANVIEGVLMRYRYGYSLCISTQVGCKMGCAFCASTLEGCVRSLSAGEMLSEVLLANRFLGERGKVGHVVLMGSGEPLDNYDQVVRFLRLLNAPQGLNISLRNVSLSTCRAGGGHPSSGGGASARYTEHLPARPERRDPPADHARGPHLSYRPADGGRAVPSGRHGEARGVRVCAH